MRTSPTTLRELREQRGLTLSATALLAGVDASAISKIETGQARATPPSIVKLAKALGISARRMARLCDAGWHDRDARQTRDQLETLRRIDLDAISGAQ